VRLLKTKAIHWKVSPLRSKELPRRRPVIRPLARADRATIGGHDNRSRAKRTIVSSISKYSAGTTLFWQSVFDRRVPAMTQSAICS
jgi:hypothetical protein